MVHVVTTKNGGSILGHAFQINRLQFRPSLVPYPFFYEKPIILQTGTEKETKTERDRQRDRFINVVHVHLKYFLSVWLILIIKKKKSIRKNNV